MKNIVIFVLIVAAIVGGVLLFLNKKTTSPSIQSHRSYSIKSLSDTSLLKPNTSTSFAFSIVDDQGNTVKDFRIAHDMLLHLIIVRKDLMEFQHLHPELNTSTGTFTLSDLTFPSAGEYRIYADFIPTSAQIGTDGIPLNVVLNEDIKVEGNYTPQSLSIGTMTKTFEGYDITLSTDPTSLSTSSTGMLSFTIKKDGRLVTDLEPYLAALGHSVVIRENTLDYIHAHAIQEPSAIQTGIIDFHTDFPSGGKYKVFTQFKHNEKVITSDFVISVEDSVSTKPSSNMHIMPDGTMMHN